MRNQKHNEGELKTLEVNIEKEIVETFEQMSHKTGISLDELVVIAMKRFQASHLDYRDEIPSLD